MDSKRTRRIIQTIETLYPEAHCELVHHDPFELLISVILSAQTTDKAVNKVTPDLFENYPDAMALAQATPEEVEPYIKTIGLYRNKAKHLVACAQQLVKEHQGRVPQTRESLMALPGVGRKTANVVLSVAFGIPAFAVDTHVERISKRLDLVEQQAKPLQVEAQLTSQIPESWWNHTHHAMIFFGRYFCTAKQPQCQECPLLLQCRYGQDHLT